MGLGPVHTIGLAEAREMARQCRQQRLNGIDPIEARNAARLEQKLATARQVTFRHCAEGWVATQQIRIGGIGDLVPMGPETPGVHAKADSSS